MEEDEPAEQLLDEVAHGLERAIAGFAFQSAERQAKDAAGRVGLLQQVPAEGGVMLLVAGEEFLAELLY